MERSASCVGYSHSRSIALHKTSFLDFFLPASMCSLLLAVDPTFAPVKIVEE